MSSQSQSPSPAQNLVIIFFILSFFLYNYLVLFCAGDGDWGWLDVNIDEDGEQFYELEVPETPDDFWFNVFSMSNENGIGLTRKTLNQKLS